MAKRSKVIAIKADSGRCCNLFSSLLHLKWTRKKNYGGIHGYITFVTPMPTDRQHNTPEILLKISLWGINNMPQYYEDKEEDLRACAGVREDFKACLLQHDCVVKVCGCLWHAFTLLETKLIQAHYLLYHLPFCRKGNCPANAWKKATAKPCRLPSLSARGQW